MNSTQGLIVLSETLENGIRRIILNQPKRRNTLSRAMIANLSRLLQEAENDANIRVVILAANGPVFSAGHDLRELAGARDSEDNGAAFFTTVMQECSALMQQIVNLSKPVIAEVAGVATAAGCQMVASCDLAVAAKSARFATPGVHIGLFCSTPMVALSRNVSRKHAMEMLLTGDMVKAKRAARIGLINKVSDDDSLTFKTVELAGKIAAKSSLTLKIGKKAFYQQAEMSLADAYRHASAVMVQNMMTKDAKEGIDAFVEKRKPVWKDA
jgi:enoyl-CoA hydratase/carnithine racemase